VEQFLDGAMIEALSALRHTVIESGKGEDSRDWAASTFD